MPLETWTKLKENCTKRYESRMIIHLWMEPRPLEIIRRYGNDVSVCQASSGESVAADFGTEDAIPVIVPRAKGARVHFIIRLLAWGL